MNTQRAFTLVETLVAITVLMIAIAGPLTIASKSLKSALYARDQIVANYLAQDALEVVKNIRDNGYLEDSAVWLPLSLNGCKNSVCKIDTASDSPSISSANGAESSDPARLYLTPEGRFTHNGAAANTRTMFSRTMEFTKASTNDNEYSVKIRVYWDGPGGVVSEEVLYGSIYNAIR